MPNLDASWIPVLALFAGLVTVALILKVIGSVFMQAVEHYELVVQARTLRNGHIRRLREIERVVRMETQARSATAAHRAAAMQAERDLLQSPPLAPDAAEEVGVDMLEAA